MINTIIYCLKAIKLNIPIQILNETFLRASESKFKSLDSILKESVIVDIVLARTNLYSGKLKKIDLKEEYMTNLNSPETIRLGMEYSCYSIPPEVREYRNITSVIGVAYPIANFLYSDNRAQTFNSIQNKTLELYENTFGRPIIYPTPFLHDNNMVRLEPQIYTSKPWLLTCMLEFDSNFTNMNINLVDPLSALCICATKILVYNQLRIPMNQAYIHGGSELGAFKEIVDSYSTALEDFEKLLMDFRGAASFDKQTALSIINLMNI